MGQSEARVLDVGNCDPDHAAIVGMLTGHFDVSVDRVMHVDEAIGRLREGRYALVLFNRLIFADGGEGIELLLRIKTDEASGSVPVMMVSNLEDAQRASVAAGGEPGFGKAAISEPSTVELLSRFLPRKQGVIS